MFGLLTHERSFDGRKGEILFKWGYIKNDHKNCLSVCLFSFVLWVTFCFALSLLFLAFFCSKSSTVSVSVYMSVCLFVLCFGCKLVSLFFPFDLYYVTSLLFNWAIQDQTFNFLLGICEKGIKQTSANQGHDSTIVDEASSTRSSPKPSLSQVIKLML